METVAENMLGKLGKWEGLGRNEKACLLTRGRAAGLVGLHWDELLDDHCLTRASMGFCANTLLEIAIKNQPLDELLKEKWGELPPHCRVQALRFQKLEWHRALPARLSRTVRRNGWSEETVGEIVEEKEEGFIVSVEHDGQPMCAFWKRDECDPY